MQFIVIYFIQSELYPLRDLGATSAQGKSMFFTKTAVVVLAVFGAVMAQSQEKKTATTTFAVASALPADCEKFIPLAFEALQDHRKKNVEFSCGGMTLKLTEFKPPSATPGIWSQLFLGGSAVGYYNGSSYYPGSSFQQDSSYQMPMNGPGGVTGAPSGPARRWDPVYYPQGSQPATFH